jgi:hypothetical protein
MKKLLGLGFALFCMATVATSCGDDDSAPAVNLDNLQKRWYNVSTKYAGATVAYDGNLPCGKDYTEYSANNVVKEVDVYDCQADPAVDSGTYTASGTILTTVIDGETLVYTIKKLNTGNLEIATTFNGAEIIYVFTSTP